MKNLVFALFMLVTLWQLADQVKKHVIDNKAGALSSGLGLLSAQKPELIAGGLVLHADRQGHFRGTVLINDIAMPFMIDTGATHTVIPVALAKQAGLPIGQLGSSQTANGTAVIMSTDIASLKLGDAELKNLPASVSFSLDEVLIGMNTLKWFNIVVQNNTMILTLTDTASVTPVTKHQNQANFVPQPPPKHARDWRKTLVCENSSPCKTIYTK
ncbi:retropepsin-like aspartic protease family protein [Methylocucumis oryzae]|uniref:retropepsin-like aspartic protease family protein n=1 Tax=Methylocucumis oryzae TaxID=1632867 RepID=UPI0006987C58|nr:retropepsin-like aspartic protease [Methylocucumis oryzae]